MDYEKLIEEHGTPTYLYDIETLINRVNYLKSKFDDGIHMVYAGSTLFNLACKSFFEISPI